MASNDLQTPEQSSENIAEVTVPVSDVQNVKINPNVSLVNADLTPVADVLTQYSCNQLVALNFSLPRNEAHNISNVSNQNLPQNAPQENTVFNSSYIVTTTSSDFNILYNLHSYNNALNCSIGQTENAHSQIQSVPNVTSFATIGSNGYLVQANSETYAYIRNFVVNSGFQSPSPNVLQSMVNAYMHGENPNSIIARFGPWLGHL